MKEQRLQNESQLVAMSHDIYEQRLDNTKNLLISNLEGFRDRIDAAENAFSVKEAKFLSELQL